MKIIYKNPDNSIAIITPTLEALESHSVEAIAKKDVPQGLPYWLVKDTEIPTDRTYRNAWELDEATMGEPDGYGGELNTFDEVI